MEIIIIYFLCYLIPFGLSWLWVYLGHNHPKGKFIEDEVETWEFWCVVIPVVNIIFVYVVWLFFWPVHLDTHSSLIDKFFHIKKMK
jgi:hypothetical protein